MRIGILTFHYAYNYGAIFQAVSLFDFISSLGHEVYMIDYRNKNIKSSYNLYPSNVTRKNLRFFMTLWIKMTMRYIRFRNFKKFINKNMELISPNEIQTLDCIVVGSDQVWNTKLTNGYDSYYWGNVKFNGIMVTYAASMNTLQLSEDEKCEIKTRLDNFNFISVRESSMLQMIQPLTRKKIHLVLDPTMLNDREYWAQKIANKQKKKKYVLAYPLRDGKTVLDIANDIAKNEDLDIKIIKGSADWNPFSRTQNTAGPQEVLTLIANAEFIITSSFHGTVLSILLNKQFYTIKCKDGNNVRTESILNVVNLNNRLIKNTSEINYKAVIDYSVVEEILSVERQKSIKFLLDSIHE